VGVVSISSASPRFTEKQGQYLAFIYTYALVNRRPPTQTDIQAFFGVTPPSVHNMVLELERRGLLRRIPRQARSLTVLVDPDDLPRIRPMPNG
jgi:Mn-dependent DtxR family transcriptional regulator